MVWGKLDAARNVWGMQNARVPSVLIYAVLLTALNVGLSDVMQACVHDVVQLMLQACLVHASTQPGREKKRKGCEKTKAIEVGNSMQKHWTRRGFKLCEDPTVTAG